MKNTRNDADEMDARGEFLDSLEALGAYIEPMRKKLLDYSEFDDFKYVTYRTALKELGCTIEHLPAIPEQAQVHHRSAMENLFNSRFTGKQFSTENLFGDCYDVREKIAKLMSMTESQLIAVFDDQSVEYVVRKYAMALREGDIKDTNNILDQALGKPIERTMTVTKKISALERLSESELRKLLEQGQPEEAEIIDMEVEQ